MKLYRRYLMREVSAAILLVLAAFLALFGFFDLIGELKNVGQTGYQLQHALLFVLLRLPGRIYELMPVAVLIGTLYALSTLARHSEITVLVDRASRDQNSGPEDFPEYAGQKPVRRVCGS